MDVVSEQKNYINMILMITLNTGRVTISCWNPDVTLPLSRDNGFWPFTDWRATATEMNAEGTRSLAPNLNLILSDTFLQFKSHPQFFYECSEWYRMIHRYTLPVLYSSSGQSSHALKVWQKVFLLVLQSFVITRRYFLANLSIRLILKPLPTLRKIATGNRRWE